MGDVEIRPRLYDPDASIPITQNNPVPLHQSAEPAKAGIMTSLYENRIFVIIIVFVIILIGLFAYFILRKTPETNKQKTIEGSGTANNNPQPAPTPANNNSQQSTPANNPQQPAANNTQQSTPANNPPKTKEALAELLNKSREASTLLDAKEQPVVTSAKSNDEIMQLMESEGDESTESEKNEESNNETEEEQEIIIDKTKCSKILANGLQCKNKPGASGLCTKHK